jgi:hypothetical protein
VRDPARQEDQGAGSGLPGLAPEEPFELAVQDEERLVACLVDVRRGANPGGTRWSTMLSRPSVSAAPTLLMVRVFGNQNGRPWSAGTTRPVFLAW